jgi:hypothetical protein
MSVYNLETHKVELPFCGKNLLGGGGDFAFLNGLVFRTEYAAGRSRRRKYVGSESPSNVAYKGN